MKKLIIVILTVIILIISGIFVYEYLSGKNNNDIKETFSELEQQNNQLQEKEEIKEDTNIKMTVIGDIMCHNTQYNDAYIASTGSYDFSYVFEDIKEYINSADLAIGNLETTFAGKSRGYSNYPTFNTPEQLAGNLKDLGIDVLSTANNHCMDKGYTGLVSTLNFLDEAEISHTGTNRTQEEQNTVLVQDVNGIKIAFLSFTYGTNGINIPSDKKYCVNLIEENLILEQIELAKKTEPDLICVSMHWGIEYQTKQNAEQKRLANLLFINGVDIILGSHPHVLQPMEKQTITLADGSEKECFVIYSLGNFMSGQTIENTRNSVILNIEITKDGESGKTKLSKVEYVPIYMYKSATGSVQRYRVLDIEKSIENYDNGNDTSIGLTTYNTINKELTKIKTTLGENIVF